MRVPSRLTIQPRDSNSHQVAPTKAIDNVPRCSSGIRRPEICEVYMNMKQKKGLKSGHIRKKEVE